MSSDDNERDRESDPPPAPPSSAASPRERPLPASVERALAEARAKDKPSGSASNSSRWLALIPVTAALFAFLLMMPRAAAPEDVPLPQIDARALEATHADDRARSASVSTKPLDGDVRAVGTALRALNKGIARGARPEELSNARAILQDAMRTALGTEPQRGIDALRTLRAVELDQFLAEVTRFEATGKTTPELEELAGGFVERMSAAGWIDGNRVILDEPERRVAYKLVWTATVGADRIPALALTLDEQRVLYTLYLRHPHAPEAERQSFETMRRLAKTDVECDKAIAKERILVEQWRAEKIKRLGELDSAYPTGYALGVAYYRAGRYDLSMEQFRTWVERHPDGPLSLRARNHMKAAFASFGPS